MIFSVHIPLIYEHIFYKYFVCQSTSQATKGRNVKILKHDFLRPNSDIVLTFSVHILLIYEHLFCKYFVRQSTSQATKGRNVKILKMRISSPLIKIHY